jgi:hypothetical protein
MSTRASPEEAESLTRPRQSTWTPRACCPSTKSTAPFGYATVDLTASRRRNASSVRLQKKVSPLISQS